MKNEIKFFALGGCGETGKSMYCIESKNSIFVFDAGVMYPASVKFGIELITVDPQYLIQNKKKVRGIIISHGHDDQLLGLLSILKEINVPVYVNGMAKLIFTESLKEAKLFNVKLIEYSHKKPLVIADLTLEFVKVCHSIIDNSIMFGKIGDFTFCYATDFIFSIDESPFFTTDILSLEKMSSKYKPTILFVSALGSSISTQVSPQHKIFKYIKDDIAYHKGRVFISTYEQNNLYAKEAIDAVRNSGKKLIVVGRMFKKIIKEMFDRKVIDVKGIIFGDEKNIQNEKNAVIMIGENGTNIFKRISMIGKGDDELIKLSKGDLFINFATAFDGTEVAAIHANGDIIKTDVEYKQLPFKKILPAHASIEEIAQLLNIVKPKYVIPVKSDWKQYHFFKEGISKIFDKEKIFISKNGDVYNFQNQMFKSKTKIDTNSLLIQSTGNTNISVSVLEDRESLANNGIILIGASVDSKGKHLGEIDVQLRGLSVQDSKNLSESIKNIVKGEIEKKYSEGIKKVRNGIRNKIQRLIMKESFKKPQVLTVITTVRN